MAMANNFCRLNKRDHKSLVVEKPEKLTNLVTSSILFFPGSVKGPDPLGDDPNSLPPRFFKEDMTSSERKAIVMKAYERLKISLDKFLKPDGSKDAPAKTCGDIKHHHPTFESGEYII